MRKRRSTKNNPINGGNNNNNNNSNNNRFLAYEFDDDQLRVETEDRKSLSKFATKSPSKKQAYCQPVDKYDFLQCFAKGKMTPENDSWSEAIDVDDSDNVLGDAYVAVSTGSSLDLLTNSLNHHDDQCYSRGTKSCVNSNREAGGYKTEKKHNTVCNIDSDEDRRKELRTSSSSDLAENKGSLEERWSQHGFSATDCEAVVVVSPEYIKYGNIYYTKCALTFSGRYITLERSTLRERRRHRRLEWSTFDIVKIEHQPCESVGVNADVVNLHLKSKDTDVVETCNRNSGTVELEFVVLDDPQWSKKQEEIKSLNLKYEAAWETIVSERSFNEHFDDIIYPEGDPDAISISRTDVELLQPKTFINDTIIDFYNKFLLNKTNPVEQHRFHFFNTFFFRKLAEIDRVLSSTSEGGKAFQRVRKWTRNVDLFEKDYIFIPVNFSLHWSLIVICHPGEVAKLRDKDVELSKRPCILHMDSIRGSHRGLEKLIRSYLWEEWKERYDKQDEDISSKFLNLRFDALQLPQQENFFDCGLFLLHYAELFLEQAVNFRTTKYSKFLNKDWFLPAEVSLKKRDHIRKLIYKIAENYASKDPPGDKYLPSVVTEEDSDVKIIQEKDVKETCHDNKFDSSIDHKNKKPQSFLDTIELNIASGSRMLSPLEKEEIETRSRLEAGEDDKRLPLDNSSGSFIVGEIDVPFGSCYGISQMSIDVQNEEEGRVPEEMQKGENECYLILSEEDHDNCIVEDSEEEVEIGTKSIRKGRSEILYIS
ncbi:hypothetical protein ACJIZ3_015645 [Penstemon smallii]|uniref:Ubiquitin-like protease family profile domain-containing protein n=1 Tax=Penstemon smallii TaxID=265156 RepID=A0ABD3RN23_9LAMI